MDPITAALAAGAAAGLTGVATQTVDAGRDREHEPVSDPRSKRPTRGPANGTRARPDSIGKEQQDWVSRKTGSAKRSGDGGLTRTLCRWPVSASVTPGSPPTPRTSPPSARHWP